jgi:hypothetical protein
MDHETDEQEPSSKEGGEMKVGDKVWVQCEVVEIHENLIKVTGSSKDNWFWAGRGQCRPVEELPKEPTQSQKIAERTMKAIWAANDSVNGTPVVKHGDPSGGWEPTKDETEYAMDRCGVPASDPLQVGDAVRFVWPGHKWHRTEGAIISTMGDPSIFVDIKEYPYRFKSDCGAFERGCSIDQLERIDQADPINPSHYKQGGIECIEAIKAATGEGFIGYVWGNVLKYLWRWPKKGGVDDLKKARWYLDRLIKEVGE